MRSSKVVSLFFRLSGLRLIDYTTWLLLVTLELGDIYWCFLLDGFVFAFEFVNRFMGFGAWEKVVGP